MHFVVSWDIKTDPPNSTRWKEINDAMKKGIGNYSWVRPLTTFYIVKVKAQADWNKIRNDLVEIAKKFGSEINFVMSPLISGGGYNGWLPGDLWAKIRERTEDKGVNN
jgi:hypothetical protein